METYEETIFDEMRDVDLQQKLPTNLSSGSSNYQSEQRMLQDYYKKICEYPLLTKEEEKKLMEKIKLGDSDAKNEFVIKNLRLVLSIAEKYRKYGLPLVDLVQEGNKELYKLVDKFNPDLGVKFSTFATPCIKNVFRNYIRLNQNVISPYINGASDFRNLQKKRKQLEAIYGRTLSDRELAEKLNISEKRLKGIIERNVCTTISLDAPVQENSDLPNLIDSIATEENPYNEIFEMELPKLIRDLLSSSLDEREIQVITLLYGLDGSNHKRTMEEVAKYIPNAYGEGTISRERVRQIEAKALKKLLAPAKNKGLHLYIED